MEPAQRDEVRNDSAGAQDNVMLDHVPQINVQFPPPEIHIEPAPSSPRPQKLPTTFQCNLCPKRFTRAYNLRSHLRTHTDDRPFVCTVCGKAFARQHDRKRHEGLHSREERFVCKGELEEDGSSWGCGRRFARADALGRHLRSEAGRVCIKPLLDEEAKKRLSKLQELQAPSAWTLPLNLLAQYPTLGNVDWSSAGSYFDNSHLDPGHDSGDLFDFKYQESYLSDERTVDPTNTCSNPDKKPGNAQRTEHDMQNIEDAKGESKENAPDSNSPNGDSHSVENIKAILTMRASSDSGYHSGLGTDTESVCSMGSVGTSLGLPQDFLQDFIAFFGDTLIDRAGARAWATYALAHHAPEVIEQRLNGLLKDYALELSSMTQFSREVEIQHKQPYQAGGTDSRIASGATKLVRRYRPKIARYFRDHAISGPLTSKSMAVASGRKDPDEYEVEDDCDDVDEGEYLADLAPIRDFLVSGKAFQSLATAMRRSLYCDHRTAMNRITYQVLERLSEADRTPCPNCSGSQDDRKRCSNHRSIYSVRFNVTWGLQEFLQSQFGNRVPRIGSLVALTGSALYAQATTCSDYLQTTWPRSGSFFLSTLQTTIDSSKEVGEKEHRRITVSTDGLDLCITFPNQTSGDKTSETSLLIDAHGTDEMLVELAQQLAWIGAALSSSPCDEKLAYCKAVIYSSGSRNPCFAISFQSEPLHPTEDPCWLPLFCGASIARDFPISERQDEMGLEMPLEIMAGIAGVRHAVEYEGGVVMKGFSSMFVPIKRSGNRVQWHLISSSDCETRLSYRDVLDRCPDRASLKEVDLECLRTTRAIVGWSSAASLLLGSNTANYENIDYSGADDVDTSLKFAGGTLGFQQFGIAQFDFTLGPKDGKCHFQRSGPYGRIISAAEKTSVVLYDTAEKRAWLVPASDVMLHVAHHHNWLEPFEVNGKRVKLFATGPAGPSAKEILLKSASIDLSDCENYTFKDMVINIWALLEFLIDQNVRRDRTPGTAVNGKLRDTIQGFEFKAVVEERSPFRRKQKSIEKTSGGWPTLVGDIDALVLFANGYEDVIRPLKDSNNQGLCSLWQSVPKWKDYLATNVKTLKDLYNVAGCRLNRTYLTSTHLQGHRGNSTLFEPCKTPGAFRCRCIRLQQIVPKSAIGRVVPPGLLVDDGAVIFGQSGSPLQDLIATPQKQKLNGIYSQPNVSLLPPVTVRQDHDDTPSSVCSESKSSARSGSDVIDSIPTSHTSYMSQESVAANMNDLKLDSEQMPCTSKRSRAPDEPLRTQSASQRDIFSSESRKRARNSQYLVAEDSQRGERRSLPIWRKDAFPESGDAMDQDGASPRESESEMRSHCGKGKRERVKQAFHEAAKSAHIHPFPRSGEIDLSNATTMDDGYPEYAPATFFSGSSSSNTLTFVPSPRDFFENVNPDRALRRQKNF